MIAVPFFFVVAPILIYFFVCASSTEATSGLYTLFLVKQFYLEDIHSIHSVNLNARASIDDARQQNVDIAL